MSGFVEIQIRRRGRGRPTARRDVRIDLRDGTRLTIGDRVPPALLRDVLRSVLRHRIRPC